MTNNPFLPVKFPAGPPTAQKNVWEDGPGAYVNTDGSPIRYNGQDQVARINAAYLPPPVSPAKCTLPGAALNMSKIP